jgi:hypothetical protein
MQSGQMVGVAAMIAGDHPHEWLIPKLYQLSQMVVRAREKEASERPARTRPS